MRRILTLVSLLFVLFFCLAALAAPAFAQTPPSAVQAQTQGTGQILITWTAVPGASGYDIYQGTASGTYTASTSVNDTITHLAVSSLNDNTTYYFIVETVASGKTGAASQEVSARSGAAQLAAPTGLTATPASGQVALAWSSVPGATAYDIFRTPDASGNNDGILVSALAATTYTDTAVANGTTYKYQVAAVCPAGTGVQAGAVPATPLSPPALAAEATANQSGTEIDLSWTASAGATSYTLYRSTTSGGETSYRTGLTGTSYADTGLPTGATYYYTLVAVAGGSSSAPSGEVSARTGSTLLGAPTLTVHPQDAQATLSWPSVSGASYYDVYRGHGVRHACVLHAGVERDGVHGRGLDGRDDLHLRGGVGERERPGVALQQRVGDAACDPDAFGSGVLAGGDRPVVDFRRRRDGVHAGSKHGWLERPVDADRLCFGDGVCGHGVVAGDELLVPVAGGERERELWFKRHGACGDVPRNSDGLDGDCGQRPGAVVVDGPFG